MIRLQRVRLDFVSIFANEAFIIRLIGVLVLSRTMDGPSSGHATYLETVAPLSDDPTVSLPAIARQPAGSFR